MPQRISFSKLGYTTLTFIGQPRHQAVVPDSGVAVSVTEGDAYSAWDKGIDSNTFILEWNIGDPPDNKGAHPLHKADYDLNFNHNTKVQSSGQTLTNWYWNICNDGQTTFTYTDADGASYTVRWVGGPPQFACPNNTHFYGKVVLRKEF